MKSLFEKEERYWSGKFDADDSLSFLPYSQSSKLSADGEAALSRACFTVLCRVNSERIISLANGSDLALYMIVLAGVKSLLFKYTGRDQVLVGMPSYSADPDGTPPPHDILVIKTSVSRQTTLKTLLGGIKASIGEALEHQHLPFRKMVEPLHLDYTGTASRSSTPSHPSPRFIRNRWVTGWRPIQFFASTFKTTPLSWK